MACRTGCPTQDHSSWGDCLRASNLQLNPGDAAANKMMPSKKWNSELDAYASARSQGIQPAGTQRHQIEAALKASETIGRAYDAGKMPPAQKLTKAHGQVMKEVGI
jgi:hypothetical protein